MAHISAAGIFQMHHLPPLLQESFTPLIQKYSMKAKVGLEGRPKFASSLPILKNVCCCLLEGLNTRTRMLGNSRRQTLQVLMCSTVFLLHRTPYRASRWCAPPSWSAGTTTLRPAWRPSASQSASTTWSTWTNCRTVPTRRRKSQRKSLPWTRSKRTRRARRPPEGSGGIAEVGNPCKCIVAWPPSELENWCR